MVKECLPIISITFTNRARKTHSILSIQWLELFYDRCAFVCCCCFFPLLPIQCARGPIEWSNLKWFSGSMSYLHSWFFVLCRLFFFVNVYFSLAVGLFALCEQFIITRMSFVCRERIIIAKQLNCFRNRTNIKIQNWIHFCVFDNICLFVALVWNTYNTADELNFCKWFVVGGNVCALRFRENVKSLHYIKSGAPWLSSSYFVFNSFMH